MAEEQPFDPIESYPPLYIKNGEEIENESKTGKRYSFERIKFSEMKCMPYPGNASSADWIPDNLNQVLCFRPVGECIPRDVTDSDGTSVQLDWAGVSPMPSGFISATGSLIPQLICPWNKGENTVELQSKVTYEIIQSEYNLGNVLWRLQDPPLMEGVTSFSDNIFNHTCPIASYPGLQAQSISMVGQKCEFDNLITGEFTRTFTAKLPSSGAYAMLMEFDVEDTLSGFAESSGSVDIVIDNDGTSTCSSDTISLTISAAAEAMVKVNSTGKASGVFNFNPQGLKVPLCFAIGKDAPPVIFMYNLLNKLVATGEFSSDPGIPGKAIKCSKNPNLDLSEIASPSYGKFPKKYKSGNAKCIHLKSPESYPVFGNQITVKWNNAYGTFGIMPMRFCPNVQFSYFFRVAGQNDFSRTGWDPNQREVFVLEYGVKYAEVDDESGEWQDTNSWRNLRTEVTPVKIAYDPKKQSTIYRVDFTIQSEDNKLQLQPFEIFSLIRISKRQGKLSSILNGNGNFSNGFKSNIDISRYNNYTRNSGLDPLGGSNYDWMKFITQVSISHSLDGSSGSITLDKNGMMKTDKIPEQVIGALTLKAVNGFYNSDGTTMNGVSYVHEDTDAYTENLPWGQIFKGYAMEVQDSRSESGSTLSVKLAGIQKKLEDMTLVNCPFWDGDQLFGEDADAVINYMIDYSGCKLKYVNDFSNGLSEEDIFLPRSADWKSPAVNFVMGTTVKEALVQLGKYTNHRFIIQPDGVGYFYYLDGKGAPTWLKNQKNKIRMTYMVSDISSLNLTPRLENKYNTFLTLGLLGEGNPDTGQMEINGTSPGYKFTQKSIEPDDYPWSRIITNKENGIVTMSELEDRHLTNVKFASATIYDGSITVPGYHKFYLFDKIKIMYYSNSSDAQPEEKVFYIIGITHNINIQNKEWTTSLQLGRYEA